MIRRAISDDLDRIMEIENASFSAGYSRDTVERCMNNTSCVFLAAEENGLLKGYALISTAADEAELLIIACAPEERRCGIASELMNSLIDAAVNAGAVKLFLEVRAGNEAAKNLYLKYDFHQIGVRKNYYTDPVEDAILMEKSL